MGMVENVLERIGYVLKEHHYMQCSEPLEISCCELSQPMDPSQTTSNLLGIVLDQSDTQCDGLMT